MGAREVFAQLSAVDDVLLMGDDVAGAIFSACERHRYLLWRAWDWGHPFLAVVGLNPSTATHEVLDPTVSRVVRRAKALGLGGAFMANLGSFRSTDPRGLLAAEGWDGGVTNDAAIGLAVTRPNVAVAAWGGPYSPRALGRMVEVRAREVLEAFRGVETTCHVLGLTSGGHPRHPLYLRNDAQLRPWSGR